MRLTSHMLNHSSSAHRDANGKLTSNAFTSAEHSFLSVLHRNSLEFAFRNTNLSFPERNLFSMS